MNHKYVNFDKLFRTSQISGIKIAITELSTARFVNFSKNFQGREIVIFQYHNFTKFYSEKETIVILNQRRIDSNLDNNLR